MRTSPPYRLAYVIFSMQRSGTSTLCGDMHRLGMNCMYELFNWGENNAGYKWGRLVKFSAEKASRYPEPYVDEVMRAYNVSPPMIGSTGGLPDARYLSGFKLFPNQAIGPRVAARLTSTCIIYRRLNVSAQYLSLKRATTFGKNCWGTSPHAKRYCKDSPPVTMGKDFSAFEKRYANWYREVEEACAGKVTLRWTMEAHLEQTRTVLKMANVL